MYIKTDNSPFTLAECIQLIATAMVYEILPEDKAQPGHLLIKDSQSGEIQSTSIVTIAENFEKSPVAQQALLKKLKSKQVIPKFYSAIIVDGVTYSSIKPVEEKPKRKKKTVVATA